MDAFKAITTRHLELLSQQQSPPEDFLAVVRQFREEIFQSGRETFAPAERDQLRSILRYWTNTINQNSAEKIYDTRDLDEFQGQPKGIAPSRRMWILGVVLFAFIAVSIGLVLKPRAYPTKPTPTVVKIAQTLTPTGLAQLQSTWTAEAVSESTSTPMPTETTVLVKEPPSITVLNVIPDQSITIQGDNFLPNETFLATMVLKEAAGSKEVVVGSLETGEGGSITVSFPIPAELVGAGQLTLRLESKGSGLATAASFDNSITIVNPGASVGFSSPINGQFISPVMVFEGSYTNLRSGWSVLLTFKPLSKGNLVFPWREAYTVRENEPNGTWKIEVDLGAQFDLLEPDEYVVDLVIANTESIREALQSGVEQGFTELPPEAIVMNKPIVVSRKAYRTINEDRILYAGWLTKEENMDLFSARLDGSDIIRITNTPHSVEENPSLSEDGKKIAFIDTEKKDGNTIYSIWTMDSNGEDRELIYTDPKRMLEGPVFSPDGRYLAYSATEPDLRAPNTIHTPRNIYVIDLNSGPAGTVEPFALTSNLDLADNFISNQWPFWLDEKSLIYSGFTTGNEYIYRINLDYLWPSQFYGKSDAFVAPPLQMPVYYKDTRLLAFHSPDMGVREIYVAVWPDGKPLRLTNNQYRDERPRWSPDGQMIIYESYPKTTNEIWAINVDGSNSHKLIGDETISAMWPYVGKMVAYFLLQP